MMNIYTELHGKKKVIKYANNVVEKPLVSVVVMTYEHERYIAKCLDSILEQKTNFDFEILLGEDSSSDKTRNICIEYANKHSDKIRLFLHDRSNVMYFGGKPSGRYNMLYSLSEARGEYIALCEGDDYWTNPNKLQKQIDFLRNNPEYSLCFHPVRVVNEDNKIKDEVFPGVTNKKRWTIENLLKGNFIQTNSVVYKRQDYSNIAVNIMPGDWYFHLFHAQFGKVGYINDIMAVYRKHPGGIWRRSDKTTNEFWKKYGVAHLMLFVELMRLYGDNSVRKKIINSQLNRAIDTLISVDDSTGSKLLNSALIELTEGETILIKSQNYEVRRLENDLLKTSDSLKILNTEIIKQQKQLDKVQRELKLIKNSKIWKLRSKIKQRGSQND